MIIPVETVAETTLETMAAVVAPTVPPVQNVMVMNDYQWLTFELEKLQELDTLILGFLLFFVVVVLLHFTYKFFRIFI